MSDTDKAKHLIACIGEECGEIQQAAGKALRFGLFDAKPGTRKTNWANMRHEIHDLISAFEMLCDEIDRVEALDRKLIAKKKARIIKYMNYAGINHHSE